jgi:RNA polymerase sigma factor, sigma-70 family
MEEALIKLDELFGRYGLLVYKIAYVYTRSVQDSEDITQELFIKLCFSAPDFKTEQHERAWVIKVTENLAKNHIKQAYKRRELSVEEVLGQATSGANNEVIDAIHKLPVKYKTVIVLYYYFGYSVKEIAALTKQSASNIKARLIRARGVLRMELEEVVND